MQNNAPLDQPIIVCVVGARPNFMKIAPIVRALQAQGRFGVMLVHTGQHYDAAMNGAFFAELGIPRPDVNLGVGSGSHAVQTAEVMKGFEPALDAVPGAAATLVVGDVNSTLACALVAAKKGVKVVHVEAGLRSYDRGMPEEINRVLTDQISEVLFTTEEGALGNLLREGVSAERVHFVGNVMIDSLLGNRDRAVPASVTFSGGGAPGFGSGGYALLTLHRPANVDDPLVLDRLLRTVAEIAARTPVAFPVHPRTRARIEAAGLLEPLRRGSVLLLPPVGYLAMLGLMSGARFVMTDSGGVQEETTALGVPCLTLRPNTERPITVEQGTNTIVGTAPAAILAAAAEVLTTGGKAGRRPEHWDGSAATRIADVLLRVL
jgi:UDP-N-acetylglucosamine 2-epimerase (non-hydrolysing)